MEFILSIIGIILSIAMIRYREQVGDMIGNPEWMHFVGGNYNFIILVAVFVFFWAIATLTGTEDILLYPLKRLIFNAVGPEGTSPVEEGF